MRTTSRCGVERVLSLRICWLCRHGLNPLWASNRVTFVLFHPTYFAVADLLVMGNEIKMVGLQIVCAFWGHRSLVLSPGAQDVLIDVCPLLQGRALHPPGR